VALNLISFGKSMTMDFIEEFEEERRAGNVTLQL